MSVLARDSDPPDTADARTLLRLVADRLGIGRSRWLFANERGESLLAAGAGCHHGVHEVLTVVNGAAREQGWVLAGTYWTGDRYLPFERLRADWLREGALVGFVVAEYADGWSDVWVGCDRRPRYRPGDFVRFAPWSEVLHHRRDLEQRGLAQPLQLDPGMSARVLEVRHAYAYAQVSTVVEGMGEGLPATQFEPVAPADPSMRVCRDWVDDSRWIGGTLRDALEGVPRPTGADLAHEARVRESLWFPDRVLDDTEFEGLSLPERAVVVVPCESAEEARKGEPRYPQMTIWMPTEYLAAASLLREISEREGWGLLEESISEEPVQHAHLRVTKGPRTIWATSMKLADDTSAVRLRGYAACRVHPGDRVRFEPSNDLFAIYSGCAPEDTFPEIKPGDEATVVAVLAGTWIQVEGSRLAYGCENFQLVSSSRGRTESIQEVIPGGTRLVEVSKGQAGKS